MESGSETSATPLLTSRVAEVEVPPAQPPVAETAEVEVPPAQPPVAETAEVEVARRRGQATLTGFGFCHTRAGDNVQDVAEVIVLDNPNQTIEKKPRNRCTKLETKRASYSWTEKASVGWRPCPKKVIENIGARTVTVNVKGNEKSNCTALLAGCVEVYWEASGGWTAQRSHHFPPLVLLTGKSNSRLASRWAGEAVKSHVEFEVTENGWITTPVFLAWCKRHLASLAGPVWLVMDMHSTHQAVTDDLRALGIHVFFVPSGCTSSLQVHDTHINAPFKSFIANAFHQHTTHFHRTDDQRAKTTPAEVFRWIGQAINSLDSRLLTRGVEDNILRRSVWEEIIDVDGVDGVGEDEEYRLYCVAEEERIAAKAKKKADAEALVAATRAERVMTRNSNFLKKAADALAVKERRELRLTAKKEREATKESKKKEREDTKEFKKKEREATKESKKKEKEKEARKNSRKAPVARGKKSSNQKVSVKNSKRVSVVYNAPEVNSSSSSDSSSSSSDSSSNSSSGSSSTGDSSSDTDSADDESEASLTGAAASSGPGPAANADDNDEDEDDGEPDAEIDEIAAQLKQQWTDQLDESYDILMDFSDEEEEGEEVLEEGEPEDE